MTQKSNTGTNRDYDVGYRKPPTHSQFKRGQSGNPRGRRRAPEQYEWKNILDRELIEKVGVFEDGKKKRITKMEALIKGAIQRALGGCTKHLKLVLDGTLDRAIERNKKYMNGADLEYVEQVWKMVQQWKSPDN